ncbi:MAG: TonB-dependent receptor, partial [Phaeodactylibacter sp.]|nr:TonB-dependent receptor [Phaeodactylibacter sp.]
LGVINVQGLELATGLNIRPSKDWKVHLFANACLLQSQVLQGEMLDRDLFSQVVHNSATKAEFIEKVNANPQAYRLFTANAQGEEVPLNKEQIESADFDQLTKVLVKFGAAAGLQDTELPYTPPLSLNAGFNADWKKLSLGVSGHFVSAQYTEFHNFTTESADGAIGRLPAFFTVDAFVNYDIEIKSKVRMNLFLNGKNLTNNIYRASRLNRATSSIFPAGFRQLIFGLNVQI